MVLSWLLMGYAIYGWCDVLPRIRRVPMRSREWGGLFGFVLGTLAASVYTAAEVRFWLLGGRRYGDWTGVRILMMGALIGLSGALLSGFGRKRFRVHGLVQSALSM